MIDEIEALPELDETTLKEMSKPSPKRETVEEFLARGGQITVLPTVSPEEIPQVIYPSSSSTACMMPLSMGQTYYAEKNTPLTKHPKPRTYRAHIPGCKRIKCETCPPLSRKGKGRKSFPN
jgi:hypothetical protein